MFNKTQLHFTVVYIKMQHCLLFSCYLSLTQHRIMKDIKKFILHSCQYVQWSRVLKKMHKYKDRALGCDMDLHSWSSFICMSRPMLSFLHLSVAPLLKLQLLYIMIMTMTATNTMWRMVAYTFVLCRGMSLCRQKWLPHFIKHWIHWYGNSSTMASWWLYTVHWIAIQQKRTVTNVENF